MLAAGSICTAEQHGHLRGKLGRRDKLQQLWNQAIQSRRAQADVINKNRRRPRHWRASAAPTVSGRSPAGDFWQAAVELEADEAFENIQPGA
jgi:hypothetical protein